MDSADVYRMINAQTSANNAWSAQQAQKQMDFQERMSSTAHQREVADLKAAGLNPVLSAGGSGAAGATGAMATPDTANTQALLDLFKMSLEAQINSAKAMSGSSNIIGKKIEDAVKDGLSSGLRYAEEAESVKNKVNDAFSSLSDDRLDDLVADDQKWKIPIIGTVSGKQVKSYARNGVFGSGFGDVISYLINKAKDKKK